MLQPFLSSMNDVFAGLFLEFGANIDSRGAFGLTPLHLAVGNGHTHAIKVLREEGATVDMKDFRGWSAMYVAAKNGRKEIISFLVDKGANLNTSIKAGSWHTVTVTSNQTCS